MTDTEDRDSRPGPHGSELPSQVTEALRYGREARGWTFAKAADRLGVSSGHLRRIEQGRVRLSEEVAKLLIEGYGLLGAEADMLREVAVPGVGRSHPSKVARHAARGDDDVRALIDRLGRTRAQRRDADSSSLSETPAVDLDAPPSVDLASTEPCDFSNLSTIGPDLAAIVNAPASSRGVTDGDVK